jgi:hypothetical protein
VVGFDIVNIEGSAPAVEQQPEDGWREDSGAQRLRVRVPTVLDIGPAFVEFVTNQPEPGGTVTGKVLEVSLLTFGNVSILDAWARLVEKLKGIPKDRVKSFACHHRWVHKAGDRKCGYCYQEGVV